MSTAEKKNFEAKNIDALDADFDLRQDASKAQTQSDNTPWYKKKLYTVCMFILVVEMCERLTYYTIMGSQRGLLTNYYGYASVQASSINAAFSVLCYFTPIFGGWLADSKLGRYKTILLFGTLYLIGTILTTISAVPQVDNKILYLVGVFVFLTVGTGGIKPNISNFGADQYGDSPEEKAEQESYFSYFYMMINVGALVAYGYLVTLASDGGGAIPQEYGYVSAYTVAAGSMFIAMLIFVAGTSYYVKKAPGGDSFRGICFYVFEGAKRTMMGKVALFGWITLIIFLFLAVAGSFLPAEMTEMFSYITLAFAMLSCVSLCVAHRRNHHYDGIEDHPSGCLTVEEAKASLDTVPILLVVNVCFSVAYNCMNGPFQSQACQSDLRVGSAQINGAFYNVGDCISIIIFVPILEKLIYPVIGKMKGSPVSRNQKLIAGLFVAVSALVMAAGGEYGRRASSVLTGQTSNCAPQGVEMSSFTGWFMFLPFFVMGIAEIMVNPVLLHFSYDQAPPRSRSLTQAFNLLGNGAVSNAFTAPLTIAMTPYYTDNLNDGHIEYLYYVYAAITIVGIPIFFYLQMSFEEKDFSKQIPANSNVANKDMIEQGNFNNSFISEEKVDKAKLDRFETAQN